MSNSPTSADSGTCAVADNVISSAPESIDREKSYVHAFDLLEQAQGILVAAGQHGLAYDVMAALVVARAKS
jgi:hypothetical protein